MFKKIDLTLSEFIEHFKENCIAEMNKGYTGEEIYDTGFDFAFIDAAGRNNRYNEYFIFFTNDGFLSVRYFSGGIMLEDIKQLEGGEYLDIVTIKKELEQKANKNDEEKQLLQKFEQILEYDKLRILMFDDLKQYIEEASQ
ncbi:hypothetical protein COA01_34600 [Bacillus cereus]|uniref:hypothetical protein n=1 Tax=Bacillus cereus TaxID=1396 RepID=UPI000BFB924F|nr:hypothetical protein [Bacillus cereus]PGP11953.1 hypothetical protein COA01_34600 [Bacillus cereus]